MNKEYTNSKIECPICAKKYAKNYLTTHLKLIHSNCYGTDYWLRYLPKYEQILKDNKKLFQHIKDAS